MSGTPDSESTALKLMENRLSGTENDSKELAKMLLDLGISPTVSANPLFTRNFSSSPLLEDPSKPNPHKVAKSPEKCVRFLHDEGKDISPQKSILKKSTIKPLQINMNSLNKEGGDGPNRNLKSQELFAKLVARLCKTESVIQSLKLSIRSLQASREASEQEKNSAVQKLNKEVSELQSTIKKQEEALAEEQHRGAHHAKRWEEAEAEVKELQNRLQRQTTMVRETGVTEDAIREKFSRKLEAAKHEIARERDVRASIEDSHRAVLSRIQDMEEAIEQERNVNQSLREDNKKLQEANKSLRTDTATFHSKAEQLSQQLASLTDELNTKEKAIRRLIEEQNQFQTCSSNMVNEQATLNKELNQCSIVLEVQKAAFSQLETENFKLKRELEEARLSALEWDQKETRQREEEEIKKSEERMNKQQFEEKMKAEMNLAIKNERKRHRELEERNRLLEECLKEQEKVLKLKEQEYNEREKEMDEKLFEEKKKAVRCMKESEQAVKAKQNLIKDLNRASSDEARDKELLQQRLVEMELEKDVITKERDHQEEENQRLLNRIASVEQQEQAYKRAQELAQASSSAKSQLAYENGKLQTRVEQLEDELRQLATVQSQVVQLRASNRAFEQKYAQVTSELAAVKVESQRMSAHVKQMQSGLQRKEEDFNLAMTARDEAVREKTAVQTQLELLKEQEKNKSNLLKRDLDDCRVDNERLTSTMNDVTQRHSELQEALDSAQVELGRKDLQLSMLNEERTKHEKDLHEFASVITKLQSALDQRDVDEQTRIGPALEALERAKEENIRLSSSLEKTLQENNQLKDDVERIKTDVDIQRERVAALLEQQQANERDALASSQTHSDRLQQMKEQFGKERAAIRKQLQLQIAEIKKTNESTQARNSQLAKSNTGLRSRVIDNEQTIEKLKEKLKQQKGSLERHQREKKSSVEATQKLKSIDDDLKDLEATKQSYMEKNKQQQQVISTFNNEVASLKDDITALSEAHLVARERNKQLESQMERERSEKQVLRDKTKMLEDAMKRAIGDRKDAEEKLRKIEVESIHVQENLQEAQSWFKSKFESLQSELTKRNGQ